MINLFFSNSRLIMEGIFVVSALVSFIFIYKLNVIKLYMGWGLFVFGLWIEFIDEFNAKSGFITIYLDGLLISIGLVITTYGFYALIKKEEKLQKDVKLAIKKETIITNEFYYESHWGKKLWVEYHINPLTKYGIEEIIVSFNDITDKKEAEEEMIYLSFHDQLTDLYNRRYFENELNRLNNSEVYR